MIDDQFFNTLAADATQAGGNTASAITVDSLREVMNRFEDFRPIRRIRVGALLWHRVKNELPSVAVGDPLGFGARIELDLDLKPSEHKVDYADGGA